MIESIFLGILQGISEFLPISSSGHLALAGLLFQVEDAGLTLNVLLHVGTLVATAIVLHKRLLDAISQGGAALLRPSRFVTSPGGQDALFVLLASIPTAIMGLSLRGQVSQWTNSPLVVGLGFSLTAVLLVSTKWASPGAVEHPTWKQALLLGVVQGVAVVPGISRSGSTIALALFLGVKRERAFELSMLMSIPAVFGAALLELPLAIHSIERLDFALLGAFVACIFGVGAMLVLKRMVVGGSFAWFALWVAPLAIATLAMATAWP